MAKILIADDSAFMRTVLRDIIVQAGHRVAAEAENGQHAVELYSLVQPDLVVLNIVMPELYGLEALRKIRKIDPNAKVIMCSAMGNQYTVVEAIQAGALDFVVKPFDSARLVEAMKRALNRI